MSGRSECAGYIKDLEAKIVDLEKKLEQSEVRRNKAADMIVAMAEEREYMVEEICGMDTCLVILKARSKNMEIENQSLTDKNDKRAANLRWWASKCTTRFQVGWSSLLCGVRRERGCLT
jgi:chromosome segregation ATPase